MLCSVRFDIDRSQNVPRSKTETLGADRKETYANKIFSPVFWPLTGAQQRISHSGIELLINTRAAWQKKKLMIYENLFSDNTQVHSRG